MVEFPQMITTITIIILITIIIVIIIIVIRLVEFPQMITTEWEIGSVQEVAFHTRGSHKGGYTYRLCKLPEKGRIGITEECFTRHVLEFATNFTMIKAHEKNSTGVWEKLEQTDLSEGTFPCGSVWRPIGKVVKKFFIIR